MDQDKRDPSKNPDRPPRWFKPPQFRGRPRDPRTQILLLTLAASLCIALLLTPSFVVTSPRYRIGDVVGRNIKARHDFLVLDEKATRQKREETAHSAPLVFDFDQEAGRRIGRKLAQAFDLMRQVLLSARPAPDAILMPDRGLATTHLPLPLEAQLKRVRELADERKQAFETILGFPVPTSIYRVLVANQFAAAMAERISGWVQTIMDAGVIATRRLPLELRSDSAQVLIRKLPTNKEELIASPQFYRDVAEAANFMEAKTSSEEGDPKELIALVFLAKQLVEPNITFNRVETAVRKVQAAEAVSPVYIQVKKNEMLVREGQQIGSEQLLKLKSYRKSAPERHELATFIALLLFAQLYGLVLLHLAREHLPNLRLRVKDILFLALIVIAFLVLARTAAMVAESLGEQIGWFDPRGLAHAIPLAAGAMLAAIFFDITTAIMFAVSMSLFAGILLGSNIYLFVYFLVGSLVGAHGVAPCRNRLVPIRAGIVVGVTNLALLVLTSLLQSPWEPGALLTSLPAGLLGGILAGILVTGLAPLAELLFGYTTDIKLLELASMDQPLLRELMVQAPGTYHHSIIVGNMVETAAKSIGANSLLVKVAAYYHDIGKTRKPLYFIENQQGCENRHEKLAPSMSALILISHVKEGIELANSYRLGKPIRDIISQHHGTSLIAFFYQKALDAHKKTQTGRGAELPMIHIEDYRYPGPKPQTKEAGLVMLADVVEAACRSLIDPTPARIQGMVSRLINNVFSDGQLDECELTLKDLHSIAKHFNQILATVHHKRIQYPGQEQGNNKGKQGAKDPAQREPGPDKSPEAAAAEGGPSDLKRLGLH